MYGNILRDNIFVNEIVSAEFDSIDDDLIMEEFNSIHKMNNVGLEISNMGGYHSPSYRDETSGYSELDKLAGLAKKFVYNEMDERNWIHSGFRSSWWIMRNVAGNYNVLHHHSATDLIGLYYPRVPKNVGDFVIMRNDGIAYSTLFSKNRQLQFHLTPEQGRFYMMPGHYWHHVEASLSATGDRVCVAFNFNEIHETLE